MNLQTGNGAAVAPRNCFGTGRSVWPVTFPPARSNRSSNRSGSRARQMLLGVIAKKVLAPCLAAFVIGKALSYVVQFSALILFTLR
jgi:hypothetical protein